jgi:hypothetical protein
MIDEIFAGDLVPEIETIPGMHVNRGKNGLHRAFGDPASLVVVPSQPILRPGGDI